ncbi:MAG TPA: hypothetical protein VN948_08670 [Terriglobales bacterium]|nr:hypothetical protein [Terriglobales bacterium]
MANSIRLVGPTLLTISICVFACARSRAQDTQQPTITPAPAEQTQHTDTQAKAAAAKAALAAARANTTSTLANSNLTGRYYLFQAVRDKKNPPDVQGISTTSLGPVVAKDVITAAGADQLYEPFGAVFDLLGSFSDAGSGAFPSAQSGIQTEALGRIEWESEHYGYENVTKGSSEVDYVGKLDFSFGGAIGLYPALVLENLSSTTETIAQPLARPMFQDAFQWQVGPRLNYPLYSHGEATFFVNLGQNFLINQVTSFKEGDNTVTATPVSNGVGRTAAFGEAGFEAKILSSTIWQAHDNKYDNLRPLFLVATGVRKDTRLSGSGDLAGYDHAQDRLFFRLFINLTKIVAYNDQVKKAAPASVRFGVDMDRGLISQRVPTATRFFVSADFNIMQVFKPSTGGQ